MMKEFEKWWNKDRSDEEFIAETEGITTQEQAIDALAKLAWRAALEWVKSHEYTIRFSPTGKVEDGRNVTLVETQVIDKELKESQNDQS